MLPPLPSKEAGAVSSRSDAGHLLLLLLLLLRGREKVVQEVGLASRLLEVRVAVAVSRVDCCLLPRR